MALDCKPMGAEMRVVHYINQYFAGAGGEDQADIGPQSRAGPIGPGAGLQRALGEGPEVVATVFCGDNYMAEKGDSAAAEVAKLISQHSPQVVVAGPSFGSGRYGLACAQVCQAVQQELKIPALAAMHEDSPAVEQYRRSVTILPTGRTAAGMAAALAGMARIALKLGRGEALGPPDIEGYFSRGERSNEFSEDNGAVRAVDMLVSRLLGKPFETEWPLPHYDAVKAPPALTTSGPIRLALVAEGGVVAKGNPDRLPSGWANKWVRYSLIGIEDLTATDFETIDGGFDTRAGNDDPDRLIPVDALRELEKEGKVQLYNELYSTVGNMGSTSNMRRIGTEMASELLRAGVDAVLVGAT
jgi:betaine reductase